MAEILDGLLEAIEVPDDEGAADARAATIRAALERARGLADDLDVTLAGRLCSAP